MQLSLRNERSELSDLITSISSTHYPLAAPEYTQMVYALLEMGMLEFGLWKGVWLDDPLFDHALVRRSILADDHCELVQDIASSINTKLCDYLQNTHPEHRFGFKMLLNGDVVIGLDPRDFIHHENQGQLSVETPMEDSVVVPFSDGQFLSEYEV